MYYVRDGDRGTGKRLGMNRYGDREAGSGLFPFLQFVKFSETEKTSNILPFRP